MGRFSDVVFYSLNGIAGRPRQIPILRVGPRIAFLFLRARILFAFLSFSPVRIFWRFLFPCVLAVVGPCFLFPPQLRLSPFRIHWRSRTFGAIGGISLTSGKWAMWPFDEVVI